MKNILIFSAFLTIIFTNTCNNGYKKQMTVQPETIDYHIIPVWYYLKTNNPEKAKEAAANLKAHLSSLDDEYKLMFKKEDTEEEFIEIENAVTHLQYLTNSEEYETAIDQAYMIVFKLSDWRSTVENEHFIDFVWDFGRSYENVKQTIIDGEYDASESYHAEDIIQDMNDSWEEIQSAGIVKYLSQKNNPKDHSKYKSSINNIDDFVSNFEDLLLEADHEDVIASFRYIESDYVRLVSMFGQFESSPEPTQDLGCRDIQIPSNTASDIDIGGHSNYYNH